MRYGVKASDASYRKRQSKSLRSRNPVRYLLNQARYRAKQRGIPFEISYEDLEIPEYCPVFGLKLETSGGRRNDCSFSLDRWDNSKGYIKGNVRVISWKANQYKGDLTLSEVEALYCYMKGIPHSLLHL